MGKDAGGDGLEVPLLKRTYYHGNCPGCRLEKRNETRRGVPYTEFACMWLVTVCSTLPIQSLFPFLYFMIRDLHIAKQVEDIGFYAGFVGASYMLGRALTSTVWGIVADKHGRKPVLVITCRKEYSHLALSLISSSRAIGLIVGPAIGGYLAQPADKYPGMFSQESIFGRFPYFLPCLCISILAVAALISCIWLPETLHKHNEATDSNNSIEAMEESLSDSNAEESSGGYWSLFTNWPLMSAITVYCLFSLQDVAYAEVFSLWAVSDRKYGGLNFTSTDVGSVLALSGLFLLIYQILIYPSVAKAIEPITLVRATAILTLPLLASYPFMTTLSGFNLQLVVNCASSLKNSFQVTTITVCNILMNDAVSQDLRASANGLSVTLMSIFKAVAPAVAGVIFSWAQRRQTASFLPGDHLVFFMLNAATVVGLMCTFGPHFARGSMKH
ncbi:unnamed protein product [Triticum turgidum subsp. durum]|uniref:Major facilitator superfamily (MFS) profile domain-containing protein n=1 Tax=Triticum turgidum subsp. durum TaxID=4567 RepID=A0A9R1QEQ4_TRITD|nr:unnamed protein product [Triticum turgidum subsp. durum]